MNLIRFLIDSGNSTYSVVAVTLPLLAIATCFLQFYAIRQATATRHYQQLWPFILLICCVWNGWALWIVISLFLSKGGAGALAILDVGPLWLPILGQAPIVLWRVLKYEPRVGTRDSVTRGPRRWNLKHTFIAMIVLIPVFAKLVQFQPRFPGLEYGLAVSFAVAWWATHLQERKCSYWLWPMLCVVTIIYMSISSRFIFISICELYGSGHLIEFTHSGPRIWQCMLWLADEPAILYPWFTCFAALLVRRPIAHSRLASMCWLGSAILVAILAFISVVLQLG